MSPGKSRPAERFSKNGENWARGSGRNARRYEAVLWPGDQAALVKERRLMTTGVFRICRRSGLMQVPYSHLSSLHGASSILGRRLQAFVHNTD